MRIGIVSGVVLAFTQVWAFGLGAEWKAGIPALRDAGGRLPIFLNAIGTENGSYVVQGVSGRDEFLLSLDSRGKTLWMNRIPHKEENGSVGFSPSLFATGNGPVAFWEIGQGVGSMARADLMAVRYDSQGRELARRSIGSVGNFVDGRFGVTSRGDALSMSSHFPFLFAEKTSLGGGKDWRISIGQGMDLDLVGFHEVDSDRYVFATNRVGDAAGDTLSVHLLDSSGSTIWSRHMPTGLKPGAPQDRRDVTWSHFAHTVDGRFFIGGIAQAYDPVTLNGKDSLVLAAVGAAGELNWIKRFPIHHPGFLRWWAIQDMTVAASGRVGIRLRSHTAITELEVALNGSLSASLAKSIPAPWSPSKLGVSRLAGGSHVAFGSSSDSLAHAPVVDGRLVATAIQHPAIHVQAHREDTAWTPKRLDGFADTVFSYNSPVHMGERNILTKGGFFLYFHLPTPDGGALVGGYMLDRLGGDTTSIAAIKLAPGYAVGLAPGRSIRGAQAPLNRKKASYDLLGRIQNGKALPKGIRFAPSPVK